MVFDRQHNPIVGLYRLPEAYKFNLHEPNRESGKKRGRRKRGKNRGIMRKSRRLGIETQKLKQRDDQLRTKKLITIENTGQTQIG